MEEFAIFVRMVAKQKPERPEPFYPPQLGFHITPNLTLRLTLV